MAEYRAFHQRLQELSQRTPKSVAQSLTTKYWSGYTGSNFHLLVDSDPDVITANDIVAVSMLSVSVPPEVSVWLLSKEGQTTTRYLLTDVPANVDIWNGRELLTQDRSMWRLWKLLESCCWPEPRRNNGIGPTTISKLLAAKRPRLVPIWDDVVRQLLTPVDDHWAALGEALSDDGLRHRLLGLSAAGAPPGTSDLRRLDVLLWMLGKKRPHEVFGPGQQR